MAQARLRGENRGGGSSPARRDGRARSALPRSPSGSPPPAPGRPPSQERPRFRSQRRRGPPGLGSGAPRSEAPSRAAQRLGRRVLGLPLQRAGCIDGPGRGGLGLVPRWTRSPGNGAGYGAPQRPNRAASLRAGTAAEVGSAKDPLEPQPAHFPFLYNPSPRNLAPPQSTASLLEINLFQKRPLPVSPETTTLRKLRETPAHCNESVYSTYCGEHPGDPCSSGRSQAKEEDG